MPVAVGQQTNRGLERCSAFQEVRNSLDGRTNLYFNYGLIDTLRSWVDYSTGLLGTDTGAQGDREPLSLNLCLKDYEVAQNNDREMLNYHKDTPRNYKETQDNRGETPNDYKEKKNNYKIPPQNYYSGPLS